MTSTTIFTDNYVLRPTNFRHGRFIIIFSFLLMLSGPIIAKAQSTTGTLPDDEVQALREIAEELNKKDWNFTDPCSNIPTVEIPRTELYNDTLTCNCSFPGNVCHIEGLFVSGQDLDGVLPRALAKLSYLKKVDLSENYLSGSIPSEWASTKLEFLVLSVNRLSGPIPHHLGKITTLRALGLESNMFSGTVPAEFGKLVNMEILFLSANNLTGQLPMSITNLTKLQILRISSNNFTGRIPEYIGSWKQLRILEMEASGFEGPIPLNLSLLNNLTELRVSDVYGESSKFPDLRNMKDMNKLMLRNCNISGRIPEYISTLTSLQTLDLTFNRLEGDIPNFGNVMKLSTIYLTGNLLSGSIPGWIKSRDSRYQIDLSYNNFDDDSVPTTCRETFNLFKSSPGQKNSMLSKCLNTCTKDLYSLHINCGGKQTTIGNIKYEGDEDPGGAAKFVRYASDTWGFSSTGDFWDVWSTQNDYIVTNVSALRMNNSILYTTARISPLSLTYFARCLGSGNYTVKLHFAETVLRDNRSYYGLGKRLFDVYIQGELKLKEYNIEKKANGVDREKIEIFKTVPVDETLEIRFQWAGKGTTNVPRRGVYGALISAISVESEFKPPSDNSKRTVFIVIGSVASLLSIIFLILFILWRKGYLGRKVSQEEGLTGHDLQTGFFTFRQIKSATNNFDISNKLGEGGFGAVYKGILSDGTTIAVKQLSFKSKQGSHEFVNEIGMISALHHQNIVKLYGCCIEGKHLLLVYEYMENNSLSHCLFGSEERLLEFDWPTRQKICVGIARGLAFLHEESILKIVHRDIKAANILLDKELNPKISDFGLARLHDEEHTHISTRIAGTIGYMAPEYALWGYLTDKVDVYSFGVVALELVAGKNNTKYRPDENYVCLLDWALHLQQQGNLMEIVDPNLINSSFNKEDAVRMIKVALLCTNPSPGLRPLMSTVMNMLEGQTVVHEVIIDQSIFGDQMQFNTLRKKSEHNTEKGCGETQTLLNSSDTIWNGSSSSTAEDIRLNNFHTL